MKHFKRLLVLVLAAAMSLTLFACGGESDGTTAPADSSSETTTAADVEKTYDKVVYAYATFNNIPSAEAKADVEEAINEITREKIGAEIELMPIAIWDYASQVSLALQGGDKIDVFQSLGDLPNAIASDMAYDLTDLVEEYAPGSLELFSEGWLDACRAEGRLYGIPTMKPIALTPMVIFRQDIADELNIDMSKVKSVYDMTEIFQQIKAARPELTPLAPVSTGDLGLIRTIDELDTLGDDMFNPMGIMHGKELEVKNPYALDEFASLAELARTWFNEGLVMKDAATTTSDAAELMSSGNYFCYIASYSYSEEDTAAAMEAQTGGFDLGAKKVGEAYLKTADINALTWMVSSTSDVPESALQFIDLTMTDPNVTNLLIYGIKDRDYVLSDAGQMSYPEGQDATTVPYTAQLSCGTLGNYFIMYPMEGTSPDSIKWEQEQNVSARMSPAMGFTFDSSKTKTEYTAVINVIQQYLPGLMCGSVDPTTELPKFLERLEEAGLGKIISEKQTQLDAWASAN